MPVPYDWENAMREVKISSLIRKSINRSELLFFRPFNLRKWLALLLIAVLAGALGGGGGFNFPRPERPTTEQSPAGEYTQAALNTEEKSSTNKAEDQENVKNEGATETKSQTENVSPAPQNPETTGGLEGAPTDKSSVDSLGGEQTESEPSQTPNPLIIVLVVVLGFGLSLLFTRLSARFRFIWLNAIRENSGAIREPFRKFKQEGNSLFKTLLVIIFGTLVYSLIILGCAFLMGRAMGVFEEGFVWHFGSGLVFVLGGLLFLGLPAIALSILFVALDDFLIAIMLLESCGFRNAWKNFVEIYGQNKKDFWLYFFVKIGLGIISALLQIMLLVGWALTAIVAGAVVFGIPYFLFSVLIKLDVVFWIIAVAVGIPYFAVFLLLLLFLNLPFAAFFRSFSLYYLSSLKTKYTPLPLE